MLNIRSSADCWSLQALHAVRLFNRHDSRHSLHIKGSSDRRSEPTLRIFSQSSTALKKKFCCGNKRCSGCVFFFPRLFSSVFASSGDRKTPPRYLYVLEITIASVGFTICTPSIRGNIPREKKKRKKRKNEFPTVLKFCVQKKNISFICWWVTQSRFLLPVWLQSNNHPTKTFLGLKLK